MAYLKAEQEITVRFPELEKHKNIYAIIINGDTEEQRHLNNVSYAVSALTAHGVKRENMRILGNNKNNKSDEQSVKETLSSISKKAGKDDLVIVYYTGHGNLEKGSTKILLENKSLDTGKILDYADELKKTNTIFVFDQCYSGNLPQEIVERGFNAQVMAPVIEGKESKCQHFAPSFWEAVKVGKDIDGNNTTSFGEAFSYAITNYNQKTGETIIGSYRKKPVELTKENYTDALSGNVIVEVYAPWCVPCRELERELNKVSGIYGEQVKVFRLNSEGKDVKELSKRLGIKIGEEKIPQTFFIGNEKGERKILSIEFGAMNIGAISKEIEKNFTIKTPQNYITKEILQGLGSLEKKRQIESMEMFIYFAPKFLPNDLLYAIKKIRNKLTSNDVEIKITAAKVLIWLHEDQGSEVFVSELEHNFLKLQSQILLSCSYVLLNYLDYQHPKNSESILVLLGNMQTELKLRSESESVDYPFFEISLQRVLIKIVENEKARISERLTALQISYNSPGYRGIFEVALRSENRYLKLNGLMLIQKKIKELQIMGREKGITRDTILRIIGEEFNGSIVSAIFKIAVYEKEMEKVRKMAIDVLYVIKSEETTLALNKILKDKSISKEIRDYTEELLKQRRK